MNIFKCGSCGNEIQYKSNYCQNCGAELDWPSDDSSSVSDEEFGYAYKCEVCGNIIQYGNEHCRNCGTELDWSNDDSSMPSEDELVMAYGLNAYIPDYSNSSRAGMLVAGGIGGLIFGELFRGAHNLLYTDCSEIKLCHSKNRLYGISPDKKHDVINVGLSDISIDYVPVAGSNFGNIIIKIPGRAKAYTYPNVYMPNRFYKSIMSAKSGKFDKSIYESGLKDLPQKSKPIETEEELDEYDDL